MKLDRNLPDNEGHGKYALLLLRNLDDCRSGTFGELPKDIEAALKLLADEGIIDQGIAGTESEFMVIRLKDEYAYDALAAYADAAERDDLEWADEVRSMLPRSGINSQWCKRPD